jgi:hypothetical protein
MRSGARRGRDSWLNLDTGSIAHLYRVGVEGPFHKRCQFDRRALS